MKKIAILGAGKVAKPLADYLLKTGHQIIMTARDVRHAEAIIADHPLGEAISWMTGQQEALDQLVGKVDLVVSMLPPTMHIPIAKACLQHGKHLVTTSYITPEMEQLDNEAKAKKLLFLNEIGEDPGLDHMGAKQMIDQVKEAGGKVTSLLSYGAGLPSFNSNRNPWGYKFSWSPKGLLSAARTAAAYLKEGEVVEVAAKDLFHHHWLVDIEGLGTFETYPNRDSRPYVSEFGLSNDVTLYRGLLRFMGWCNTMKALTKLELLEDRTTQDLSGRTYLEFTTALVGKANGKIDDVATFLNLNVKSDVVLRLQWLGLFDNTAIAMKSGTNADVLLDLMLRKLSYTNDETDMIIVHDEIIAEFSDRKEKRTSTLHVTGKVNEDSAMSQAVSLPAAIAAHFILQEKITLTGVRRPMHSEIYQPVLKTMEDFGFKFKHSTTSLS